ncbi:securin isoform X2 [Phyllopteryx taeniolatus]|uniref:securin isoform X2 n=1 Tax=Phyllopteryx taeniolatus TaxID=161469 RepID=UPI002AD5693E|nr:securin isoform X2 [Phyllopteryx taeniolatus]
MDHINAERENQSLSFKPELSLKTPLKSMRTPLRPGRKAFGTLNTQLLSTPVVNKQEKKTEKLQEAKVKHAAQKKAEDYPEIEKLIPYDPLEFEKYSVPEDLVPLGSLALAGLALPQMPSPSEDDMHPYLPPLPSMSPERMPQRSDGSEYDTFLQTIKELTIELPPEPDTD